MAAKASLASLRTVSTSRTERLCGDTMYRATFLLLSLLCVSGCESPGGNSLAAFGPNTIPPAVRQPGSDPYYTASSAAPSTTKSAATNPVAGSTLGASPPTSTPPAPATIASTSKPDSATRAATVPSNEPPIRIIESGSSLPATMRPADETSRLPATSTTSPSPLQRTSVTPKLQPIPSSAFGGKAKSSTVMPASYEEASSTGSMNNNWRQR